MKPKLAANAGWVLRRSLSRRMIEAVLVITLLELAPALAGMGFPVWLSNQNLRRSRCRSIGLSRRSAAGMRITRAQCEQMTREQIYNDYYLPLVKAVPGYTTFPVGVQAAVLSGAYNFGVGSVASKKGMARSTAIRWHMQGQFHMGCEAQAAFNNAGGDVVPGLVRRRKMGDPQRIGEAELCVWGCRHIGAPHETGRPARQEGPA